MTPHIPAVKRELGIKESSLLPADHEKLNACIKRRLSLLDGDVEATGNHFRRNESDLTLPQGKSLAVFALEAMTRIDAFIRTLTLKRAEICTPEECESVANHLRRLCMAEGNMKNIGDPKFANKLIKELASLVEKEEEIAADVDLGLLCIEFILKRMGKDYKLEWIRLWLDDHDKFVKLHKDLRQVTSCVASAIKDITGFGTWMVQYRAAYDGTQQLAFVDALEGAYQREKDWLEEKTQLRTIGDKIFQNTALSADDREYLEERETPAVLYFALAAQVGAAALANGNRRLVEKLVTQEFRINILGHTRLHNVGKIQTLKEAIRAVTVLNPVHARQFAGIYCCELFENAKNRRNAEKTFDDEFLKAAKAEIKFLLEGMNKLLPLFGPQQGFNVALKAAVKKYAVCHELRRPEPNKEWVASVFLGGAAAFAKMVELDEALTGKWTVQGTRGLRHYQTVSVLEECAALTSIFYEVSNGDTEPRDELSKEFEEMRQIMEQAKYKIYRSYCHDEAERMLTSIRSAQGKAAIETAWRAMDRSGLRKFKAFSDFHIKQGESQKSKQLEKLVAGDLFAKMQTAKAKAMPKAQMKPPQ